MDNQISLGGFKMETPKAKCVFCHKKLTNKKGWGGKSSGEYYHSDCYEEQLRHLTRFGRFKSNGEANGK